MAPWGVGWSHGIFLCLASLFASFWMTIKAISPEIDIDTAVLNYAKHAEDDAEMLVVQRARRLSGMANHQFVHIYDWQLQRWVTFWPPGMAPPPILNRSGEWQLPDDAEEEMDQTTLDSQNSFLLPPATLSPPAGATVDWVAIPNLLHGNPSLYTTIGTEGEGMWFVVYGDLHGDLPQGDGLEAALWALMSQHQSTVIRNVEQLTFETLSDMEGHSSCTLHLTRGTWDCGEDFGETFGEDPPPCTAEACSHAVLVVGDAMEWLDEAGTSLRFMFSDHVWSMRVDERSAAGTTVLFHMSSSRLLPVISTGTESLPWSHMAEDIASSSSSANDLLALPPANSPTGTILTFQWCTLTAASLLVIMVVLYVVAHALRIVQCKDSSPTLPINRIPSAEEANTQTSGRWCISGRVLGRGAFGVVYQGLDPLTGQIVAVKELAITRATEVEREVQLLATLKHPNIVSYLGSYTTDSTLCLVMEYMPCGSLETILHTYKFIVLPALRRYTTDILHGLSYLHGNNIIHRDIKPANILIGQDGLCKLADFGLSRSHCEDVDIYRSLSATDVARTIPMGTPAYMSPEAIQGNPCMASDIWAVGMTVLELASGQKPWIHLRASQPMALLVAIVREAETGYRIPEWLPAPFTDFLRHCLTPGPACRATAESLLCNPWIVTPNAAEALVVPDWFDQQGGHISKTLSTVESSTGKSEWGKPYASHMTSDSEMSEGSSTTGLSQSVCSIGPGVLPAVAAAAPPVRAAASFDCPLRNSSIRGAPH